MSCTNWTGKESLMQKESSRKRRKVALDSKVRVVNELVDEGKSESDEDSE